MSLKVHIALGTLLGVLLGGSAVAFLSGTPASAAPDAAASEVESSEEDSGRSLDEAEALGSNASYRRPLRPGAARRLLQS